MQANFAELGYSSSNEHKHSQAETCWGDYPIKMAKCGEVAGFTNKLLLAVVLIGIDGFVGSQTILLEYHPSLWRNPKNNQPTKAGV
jgi:hypothetical protein